MEHLVAMETQEQLYQIFYVLLNRYILFTLSRHIPANLCFGEEDQSEVVCSHANLFLPRVVHLLVVQLHPLSI